MAVMDQKITDKYAIYNGDSIEGMAALPAGKVHLSVYSPPFATKDGGLYTYSSSDRDLSNCKTYEKFFEHYTFMVREIARITMPGRMSCVHCMDLPASNSGDDCLIDFPGDIIKLHEREGFKLRARHIIWKEPLAVRNRTMAKNLAHKSIVMDSTMAGVASADQVLVFKRNGKNPIPVTNDHGLLTYYGAGEVPAELLKYKGWTGNQIENRYSHWIWRQYASSIWGDIRMGKNSVLPFQRSRDEEDERHVHPLQLDVIERCVQLRSNPGEIVLTPCMGVGSEVYGAVKAGRVGIGWELKPSYFRQSVMNLDTVDSDIALNNDQEEISFDETMD